MNKIKSCPNHGAFIKTTYDISLDSQISLLPLGFSLYLNGNRGKVGSRGVHKEEDTTSGSGIDQAAVMFVRRKVKKKPMMTAAAWSMDGIFIKKQE